MHSEQVKQAQKLAPCIGFERYKQEDDFTKPSAEGFFAKGAIMDTVRFAPENIDKFTGFLAQVTSDHSYIHDGIGYALSGASASISAAGTWVLSITTPASNDAYVHFRPTGISSSANTLQMRIAEGSTVTGGSAATPQNRNRNSKRKPLVTVATGVTLSAEGTILDYTQVGSGASASSSRGGGGNGSDEEWVLKPSTVYSFRFENIGATTATVAYYSLFWYEETEGV